MSDVGKKNQEEAHWSAYKAQGQSPCRPSTVIQLSAEIARGVIMAKNHHSRW